MRIAINSENSVTLFAEMGFEEKLFGNWYNSKVRWIGMGGDKDMVKRGYYKNLYIHFEPKEVEEND